MTVTYKKITMQELRSQFHACILLIRITGHDLDGISALEVGWIVLALTTAVFSK